MRAHVPTPLDLDLFDSKAWLAVVPFWMSGIRNRGLPPVPGISRFPELNVRTYVRYRDKPGVYFFSLDAASALAVWGARTFFHLPYFHADMECREVNGEVNYHSLRRHGSAQFDARYRPTNPVQLGAPGTIENWLTERYCLFTVANNTVYRCDIHHPQWPLQNASADVITNTMSDAAGLRQPQDAPLLHFSKRLDVLIWPLQRA